VSNNQVGWQDRAVEWTTVACGSDGGLERALRAGLLGELAGADVVIVATPAAFVGATEAAVRVGALFDGTEARVEGLMAGDRAACEDPYFSRRALEADLAVLLDGSAMHARAAWRASALGAALARTARICAIGATASLVLDEMVDPRGGAPTTGLGWRRGAVLAADDGSGALERTLGLVAAGRLVIALGPDGSVAECDGRWRKLAGAVAAYRDGIEIELA
jgi:hypothetical protein